MEWSWVETNEVEEDSNYKQLEVFYDKDFRRDMLVKNGIFLPVSFFIKIPYYEAGRSMLMYLTGKQREVLWEIIRHGNVLRLPKHEHFSAKKQYENLSDLLNDYMKECNK